MNKRYAITILAYGNLELTKRTVVSALEQDIGPCDIHVIDNGSKDNTWYWLLDQKGNHGHHTIWPYHYEDNRSPIYVGNRMMEELFRNYEMVLGLPNDVIIPPNLYRLMNLWPRGFVTASMTSDPNFSVSEDVCAVNECTPMAVSLIRRWMHEAMVSRWGYFFDEGFFHYASDCDVALRMGACGIRGVQLSIPYYHETSATLKRAESNIGRQMQMQADADRAYFIRKWGYPVADPYYGQQASDINFRGEHLLDNAKMLVENR